MWNFKGDLWNSTQNILPIHWKIQFFYNTEILRALRFKSSYTFLKCPPGLLGHLWQSNTWCYCYHFFKYSYNLSKKCFSLFYSWIFVNIVSHNELSAAQRQAITWSNADLLSVGLFETNFDEILMAVEAFSLKKLRLQIELSLLIMTARCNFLPQDTIFCRAWHKE